MESSSAKSLRFRIYSVCNSSNAASSRSMSTSTRSTVARDPSRSLQTFVCSASQSERVRRFEESFGS